MKGFDIESDPQDVLFNMGNFDVAIIEKSVLIVQDVLTQIRSNLFVSKENLGLVHTCDFAENSKEVRLDVEATIDIEFDAIGELLLATHCIVANSFHRRTFG